LVAAEGPILMLQPHPDFQGWVLRPRQATRVAGHGDRMDGRSALWPMRTRAPNPKKRRGVWGALDMAPLPQGVLKSNQWSNAHQHHHHHQYFETNSLLIQEDFNRARKTENFISQFLARNHCTPTFGRYPPCGGGGIPAPGQLDALYTVGAAPLQDVPLAGGRRGDGDPQI